jgi:hypothetical protein
MEAVKIEIVMQDNADTEYFITQILPELKKKWKMKQVFYSKCKFFEK